jgi:hypothetical protein
MYCGARRQDAICHDILCLEDTRCVQKAYTLTPVVRKTCAMVRAARTTFVMTFCVQKANVLTLFVW